MKKILIVIITFLIFMSNGQALEINSEKAIMYNLNDNSIVFSKNKDKITKIASLTKIMTTLVAIEQIQNYDEEIIIKEEMFKGLYEANAAVIGLKNNQKVTYNDLLYGTFLASGADATRALTISIATTEKQFVELMNERAEKIGLKKTNFTNAIGLDEEGQSSTVNEVSLLLIEALKNPKFKEIFASQNYTLSDKSIKIENTLSITAKRNNLDINYIKGAKTGYTDESGFSLASTAYDKTNKIEYLLVTVNAPISYERAAHLEDAINIYNYFFANYKYYNLYKQGDILITLNTKNSKTKTINFKSPEVINYYSKTNFDKTKVKLIYEGKDIISPFTKKNTYLGTIKIKYKDEIIKIIKVNHETKISFSLIEYLKTNKVIISLIIVLFSGVIYIRRNC